MKMIYLIFIVSCFINQLKADVFTVEVKDIFESDTSLATIKKDPNFIVTFLRELEKGDIKFEATILDSESRYISDFFSESPCNTDTSTNEGTLAAILWRALGVESCPVEAGDYPAASKFDQTGVIEGTFKSVNELVIITFELYNLRNQKYFELETEVRLVEESSSNQNDV